MVFCVIVNTTAIHCEFFQALLWVDIVQGKLFIYDPETNTNDMVRIRLSQHGSSIMHQSIGTL